MSVGVWVWVDVFQILKVKNFEHVLFTCFDVKGADTLTNTFAQVNKGSEGGGRVSSLLERKNNIGKNSHPSTNRFDLGQLARG